MNIRVCVGGDWGWVWANGCVCVVPETWSESLKEAVKAEEVGVVDYELVLDYNYWNYCRFLAVPVCQTDCRGNGLTDTR